MRKIKLPPFQNVGAGQKALMPRIQQGEVFHGILLKLGGTFTKAHITRLLIRLGGKVIWDVTGAQLDTMNQYMGMTANASYLLIPFSEFNARTLLGEQIGAIDTRTAVYSDFALEADIDAAAVTPSLEAWKLVTNEKIVGDARHLPLFKAMIPGIHTPNSSGTHNLDVAVGSAAGSLVKRLHFWHVNIIEQSVKRDGQDIYDQVPNALAQFWQNNLTRVTQAGHLCFDPLTLDNQSEALATVRPDGRRVSYEWRSTLSAGDTITTVSELYAGIGSI
jgi:hypothetical protein